MKHLIIIILVTISIISCKKDITEEKNHFLRGRLLTECNGTAVPDTEVQLWRDFKPGNFLVADKPEKLLETAATNSEGYFYFIGNDSYVKKNTSTISRASIRLSASIHSKIAIGQLGENSDYNSQTGEVHLNKNVGNLYTNGLKTDITFNISSLKLNVSYDSVKIIPLSFNSPILMLTNSTSNYFTTTVNDIFINPKHMSSPGYYLDNHTKFFINYQLFFYSNGNSSSAFYKSIYVNDCSESNTIQFDF